ncbi:hypothetical protein N665_0103s0030 [Sinapis alba]|nr:hypothetical protein N665_0103s0030 [Sinapis alba]
MNNDGGIPSRCWCGKGIFTYVSKTEENPYKRFFRCEIGLQIKKENHLFKWVDEALFDEIERMEEHQTRIVEELEDLRSSMKKTIHEEVMKHNNSLNRLEFLVMHGSYLRLSRICVSFSYLQLVYSLEEGLLTAPHEMELPRIFWDTNRIYAFFIS